MLFAIMAIWLGYKRGVDSGRNGVLWGAICGGAFIGTQMLVTFGAGIFMGLGVAFLGWRETIFEDYSILITIGAIVASFVTLLSILKYLNRIPDDPIETAPPPPPTFDGNE